MRDLLTVLAGLVLLTLLTALVGPAFVDWSQHRAAIEERLTRISGLEVVTTGPIQLRLLPTPRLAVTGVRIGEADPIGTRISASRVVGEMEIGPLLRGEIRLSRLSLDGAELSLAWRDGMIALPAIEARSGPLPGVDRLGITQGQIVARDESGVTLAALSLTGELSAPQWPGAIRFEGDVGGRALRLSLGERDAEGRVRIKALGGDTALRADFDGWLGVTRSAEGRLSLKPEGQLQAQLLANASTPAPPLATLTGKISARAEALALETLVLETPQGRLEGEARWSNEAATPLAVTLQARRADLAGWLGQAEAVSVALAPFGWVGERLPDLSLSLKLDQLGYRGEEAQDVELVALLREGHWRPVRGHLRFAGATARFAGVTPGEYRAALQAPDLRRIALAMQRLDLPQGLTEDIAALGAVEIGIDLAPDRLGWRAPRWSASGAFGQLSGSGRLIDGRLDLQGQVERADLLFLMRPLSALTGLWPGDLNLALTATGVRIGDSPQGRGGLNAARSGGAWRIEALSLGGFDGLTLALRRTVGDPALPFTLEAARAEAIAALAERIAATPRLVQIARALRGVSPVRLQGVATPLADAWRFSATGQAGPVAIDAAGLMHPTGAWRGGEISLSASERAVLFRVLGLPAPAAASAPTRATLRLAESGPLLLLSGADGLSLEARAATPEQAFAAGLDAQLSAPSLGAVLPTPEPELAPAGPLNARFRLQIGQEALTLEGLRADTGAGTTQGRLEITAGGAIRGELTVPRITAAALPALLLPGTAWRTEAGWSGARFPSADPQGALTLDLALQSAEVRVPGFPVLGGSGRLAVGKGAARITGLSLEGDGVRLQGAAEMERAGGLVSLRLAGAASGLDLRAMTAGEISGTATISAQLGASGESPARLIAGLGGTAQVTAPTLSLARLDPQGLDRILQALDRDIMVTDAAALAQSIRRHVEVGSWPLSPASLPFVVTAGVARLSPLTEERGPVQLTVSAAHDLRSGEGEWRAAMQMKAAPRGWSGPPPQVTAIARGPWGQMARSYDASVLSNAVAQRALERELARVEALEADIRERAMHNRRLRAERERREAEQRAAAAELVRQREEAARQREEASRLERERQDALRAEQARLEQQRQDNLRQEALRQEAARQESARQEALRQEALRAERARQEEARQQQLRFGLQQLGREAPPAAAPALPPPVTIMPIPTPRPERTLGPPASLAPLPGATAPAATN